MYIYNAKIISVVDGDTVHAQIDLGFDQYCNKTLRLAGINAPEMSTPAGPVAKQALMDLLGVMAGMFPPTVRIETLKDKREKYGRYLATIFVGDVNVNRKMVDEGFAVEYMV